MIYRFLYKKLFILPEAKDIKMKLMLNKRTSSLRLQSNDNIMLLTAPPFRHFVSNFLYSSYFFYQIVYITLFYRNQWTLINFFCYIVETS